MRYKMKKLIICLIKGEENAVPCCFRRVGSMRIIIINNTGGKK